MAVWPWWVQCKWEQWQILHRDLDLRPHLPATEPCTPDSLYRFLDRFGDVYVKPRHGAQGRGVTRVWWDGEAYHLHCANRHPIGGIAREELPDLLRQAVGPLRSCVVQQAIPLPRLGGRPFDIRVMVQRGEGGRWQCSGLLAKVAGPHSAVTNVALSRGRVVPVEEALAVAFGLDPVQVEDRKAALARLSLRAVAQLEAAGIESFEAGIDAALDPALHPWILEVNEAQPSYDLFRQLPSPELWQRILDTHAAYRRWRWEQWVRTLLGWPGPANPGAGAGTPRDG